MAAITVSAGVLIITLLLGHIFHAAINRIAKVEHDFSEMMELKHRAEAADVAKSQVHLSCIKLPAVHPLHYFPLSFLPSVCNNFFWLRQSFLSLL